MINFFEFVMNPIFSQSFVDKFAFMGDFGIILLAFLKMGIMAIGSLVLCLPVLPILYKVCKKLFIESLTEEEYEEYIAEKKAKKRLKAAKCKAKNYQLANHR
jgi:hypothetical protein